MNLRSLDLNLLLAFDVLTREGSVTRAAAKLNISQPAMSGALARLRQRFADPLFVRQGGQMRPTTRARQLAGPIGAAIAMLRESLEPPERFRPRQSRRGFLIAASDYVEAIALGPLITALRREAPSVTIRTLRPPQGLIPPEDALRAGEVDLALSMFPAAPRPRPDLYSSVLAHDRIVAVVRARHPRVGKALGLKAFLAAPHIRIVYPRDVRMGLVDTVLASLGHERRVALTVANIVPVPAIVASSDLLGVVPERLARAWARSHSIRVHRLPIAMPDLLLTMVWHESRQRDPVQVWLRELVARELSALDRHKPTTRTQ